MRGMNVATRWRELDDSRKDLLLGVLGAALAIAGLLIETAEWEPWSRSPDALGIGLMIICGGSLAGARRLPLAAGLLTAAAYTTASGLEYSVWLSELVSLFIVGVCAAHTSRRATLVLGAAVVAMAVGGVIWEGGVTPAILLEAVALAAVPVAIGDAFRVRRELAAEAEARVERLEHMRELELERAVAEERLRIARDVHDVVGHHLSAIAIQAGVGARLAGEEGDGAAADTLGTIGNLTSTALGETRRLLGLVRTEAERRAPGLPGAEEIEELAGRTAHDGLEVTVRRFGEERPLDGVLGDCAYRIVQEALTNVARHAAADHAVVELRYGQSGVELVIDDDGVGSAPYGVGHGLIGMRERVAVVGGELSAGPRADRGWRIHARLPYATAAGR